MINIRHKASMRKCLWKDVRKEGHKVNSELSQILDTLDPGPQYPLIEVTLPFGAEILKKSVLQLPTASGDMAPFTDPQFARELQEQLGYNRGSNPVALVLEGSTEIFLDLEGRTIPTIYGLITPGKLFGGWRIVNSGISHSSAFLWGMTAGARSMGLIAKISHGKSHNRLVKNFHISQDIPKHFGEHWFQLRQLYQSENFGESWTLKLLFFTKEWFEDHFWKDPAWIPFRCYLLDSVCQSSDFRRNEYIYNLIFSLIQERGHLKINPFASNTAKHLIYMGMGATPGFAPAIDNTPGPVDRFQDIYNNDYHLNCAPIIMHPHMFSMEENRSIYHSLAYPTTVEFTQKLRVLSSKITDLWQVNYYLDKFARAIRTENLNITDIPLYDLFSKVEFTCYHTENENYQTIRSCSALPIDDPYLLSPKQCNGKEFPELNVFTRGCIRVSVKKNK